MAHDLFISYSNKDKPIADGICANLEAAGVRCWLAPRDIGPGEDWPTAIANAISQSKVMVLVFSSHSNASEEVSRELFLAANSKVVIIPFKIENVEPEAGKQYYLGRTHWLDAMNPPTKEQIRLLIERVKAFLPDVIVDPPPPPPAPSRWPYLLIPAALVLLLAFAWLVFPSLFAGLKASPTAIPQASLVQMVPTSQSQYIFQDDFFDATGGLDVSMDAISERRYQAGEYYMRVGPGVAGSGTSKYSSTFRNCYNNWSVTGLSELANVAIDVDARFVGGPNDSTYGVIFHFQDMFHFYYYQISPNGYWALVQRTPEGFSDQTTLTQSPAIKTGYATNHMRIELTDQAALYVNGQLISDPYLPNSPGDVGLWVDNCSSGTFEAAFDNLVVTRLP